MSPIDFEHAQAIISSRHIHLSDEQLLSRLKLILEREGHLSGFLIDETEDLPSSSTFASRFGSLPRAYTLVGWDPGRDYRYLEINRGLRKQHANLISQICDQLLGNGAHVHIDEHTDLLTINHEYTASLVLARCRDTKAGNQRWLVRFDAALQSDITIAARLTPSNDAILDYYLLPSMAELGSQLRLSKENSLPLEVYRFDDLKFFTAIARRTQIEDVA